MLLVVKFVRLKYHKTYSKGKDCSNKFRSKHSTVLVMCLLRNLLEQSLHETYSRIQEFKNSKIA